MAICLNGISFLSTVLYCAEKDLLNKFFKNTFLLILEIKVELSYKGLGIFDTCLFEELTQSSPNGLTTTDTSDSVSCQKTDRFGVLEGKVLNLGV
jgi:hypothetical protein